MNNINERLKELGILLPKTLKNPDFSFLPARQSGNLVYISGQDCRVRGELIYKGKLGRDLTIEQGQEAARQCIINSLGVLETHIGNLNNVSKIVKVLGFVNSAPGFVDQPYVMNGASRLLEEIFGEDGKHSRSAIGANELPFDTPVEIEMIVEVNEL